jgi:Spy/CpxP family protein refolding chaperone
LRLGFTSHYEEKSWLLTGHFDVINLQTHYQKDLTGGSIMKIIINGKRGLVSLIVAVLLLAPGLAQAKDWGQFKERRDKTFKEMKLSPEKTKEIQQVEERYAKERKETLDNLKKNQDELKQAMAAATPDESKVKELVSNIVSMQDKLVDSYKSQRNDELALMTPVQQGKYIQALGEWKYQKMEKKKAKKGKKSGQ